MVIYDNDEDDDDDDGDYEGDDDDYINENYDNVDDVVAMFQLIGLNKLIGILPLAYGDI